MSLRNCDGNQLHILFSNDKYTISRMKHDDGTTAARCRRENNFKRGKGGGTVVHITRAINAEALIQSA